MKTRFFAKIFFGYIFLIVFLLSLFTLLTINNSKKQQISLIYEKIKNAVDIVGTVAENFTDTQGKFHKLLQEIDKKTGVRITIIAFSGEVLLDSESEPSSMENQSESPEFKRALEYGYAKAIRWGSIPETQVFYYAKKSSRFIVRGSFPIENLSFIGTSKLNQFYRIFLILFLPGLLFSVFLSNFVYSPVREILRITEKIKSGNDIMKPIVMRKDEIGKIIENIAEIGNKSQQIKKTEETIRDKFINFIKVVDFPVAIIKVDGDIQNCNDFFRQIVEIEKETGYWWEKIKNFELSRLIKETIDKKEPAEKELKLKEKIFVCKTIPFFENDEIFVLMFDITTAKSLDKKRKEFLTAISHELKTPLTAIKGYIETLKEETTDPEKQKYIDIIFHNTERMSRILQDIITLSKLENPEIEVEMLPVDLEKIAKNVFSLYEKKALKKGLFISLRSQNIPLIKGDEFKLEQMLINLVDNAIKYTEKGKIEITLEYRQDIKSIRIEIADTGIGIGKEHLPYIFEKFYVADKSRSRNTGGTGLGLAIVKDIVLLHNGRIEVESTPGFGTRFIVYLPA
ncbi:MAG: ATP-binding protein [Candidatus Omnitrophica bacterium]|nr:ATP-binding protein [Candidatus Omnitrophota bacterium]